MKEQTTRVEAIENEIRGLSREEFVELLDWLLEENGAGWDRQIEEDAAAGRREKLDRLFETALTDYTDEKVNEALQARALLQGQEEALKEQPLGERIGHLRGQLHLQQDSDPWREHLRESNFRP